MADEMKKNPSEQSGEPGKEQGKDWSHQQHPKEHQDPSKKNPSHDPGNLEDENKEQQGGQRRAS